MKKILQLELFLFLLAGLNTGALAQRIYPNFTSTVINTSDYYVQINYAGLMSGSDDCNGSRAEVNILRRPDDVTVLITTNPSKPDGTLNYSVGPDYNLSCTILYKEGNPDQTGACYKWQWSNWEGHPDEDTRAVYTLSTVSIKSPVNITASNLEYFDKIDIKWTKGSDIPDTFIVGFTVRGLYHRIYRGTTNQPAQSALVATVSGGTNTWTDNTIVPNDQYYYWVTTYTDGYGGKESPRTTANAVQGKAKSFSVNASDGSYTNSVKVTWTNLSSFADEVRIERSIPSSSDREELDILSKNATAYSDASAIPGYNYTYYVTPIQSGRTFPSLSNQGYVKPNGTISGYVKSLLNAGVSGVQVCANPTSAITIPAGAVSMPSGGYCATTDNDGYFEIRNVYYYSEAEFSIVPAKGGTVAHVFSPATATRRLNVNSRTCSGVNFTDESVFTVGGQVLFPISSTGAVCGVPDVEIKLNGQSRGIYTDSEGKWEFTLQDEGTYTFKPVFLHHQFEDPSGDSETAVLVRGDVTTINYTDVQKDSIKVRVQGGCGDPLADSVKIQVTSPGNCFNETYWTDGSGLITLRDLPARRYDVKVIDLLPENSNILDQIGDKPVTVDLTQRDTTENITSRQDTTIVPGRSLMLPNGTIIEIPPDTTITTVTDTIRSEVIPVADFIYHSPLKITVNFADAGANVTSCQTPDGKYITLMEQNISYPLVFEVVEELGDCPVEEGTLRIFDFVSDQGDNPVEVPIKNGFATYMVTAGLPEIAESQTHNHQKLIYVMPEVGFLDAQPLEYWIMVTGVQTQTASFITRSPEIPFLILHDPPGDKSTAYVEKGTVIRSFNTYQIGVGGEFGAYANLMIGAKVLTPFSSNAAGMKLNLGITEGTDEFWRDGFETTITFNEKFSTSDLDVLDGNNGDVYIGASLNQEFALGDELTYDEDNCEVKLDVVPTMDITGFATTFVYTEQHLINTLLPMLGTLRAAIIDGKTESELTEEEKYQANQLLYDSLHWENVIAQNKANRDTNAVFRKNISFSAGAPYESSFASEEKNSESFEYNTFINTDFAIGAKIINEAGAWYDSELGVTAKIRYNNKGESGSDTTTTRTVGFTLDDDDMGDFFSIDILEDTAYAVPAFKLVLGTTSCPHEPGTQQRDKAKIDITPPQINNVPIGGKAVFTANLINQSESRETREYSVQVVSTSNPDGALVKLAGESINFKPASFWIDFNQTNSIALTIEKGPLATNYNRIGIMMFPSCEMEQWDEGGDVTSSDTAWVYVDFQSECSNVALYLPGDGWMVNKNSNNNLHVSFTGYDVNNEKLESITLQYKKEGQGWIDQFTVPKTSLVGGNFYDYNFDVSGLTDGDYRIRAKAYCGVDGGYSYSSEQMGKIDRTSLAPFGMPSPADGYLRLGQEISVTFDKNIDCDFSSYDPPSPAAYIAIFTEDSTEIPVTVQCSESQNKIILVPNQDLFSQPELEGVRLFATVEGVRDISGNIQKYPTNWSFQVNVSPVSWNPETVFMSAEEAESVAISANLDNSSVISKSFIISEWPDWMVPSVNSASILAGNSFTIQFNTVENLKPGLYSGNVTALIDDVPEILPVTLELYAREINWEVNRNDFEYNMNIVAQFSSDQENTNLSTCTRDKIAAYINGDLRGVGNISYIPELNKYAAFINIFSNQAGKNGSLLEAEDNIADNSVQDISVTDNGVASLAERFKKTNWIDFDIYATKNATNQVQLRIASVNQGNLQLLIDGVVLQTLAVPNTGNLTTFNTIGTTLTISKGVHRFRVLSTNGEFDLNWINFPEYHVRNQYSDEVIKFRMWDGLNGIEYGAVEELTFFNDGVVGTAQAPFILHPAGGIQDVVLAKGWNWISVNKISPDMGLKKVFESITPPTSPNNLTLKSQTAFSQFSQATGWQGNLTTIDPRLGYMIYLSAQSDTLSMIGTTPSGSLTFDLSPKWNWIGYPQAGIMEVNDVLGELSASPGDILKSQFDFDEFNETSGKWIGDLKFFEPGRGYKLFVLNGGSLDMLKSAAPDELKRKYEYTMTLTAVVLPTELKTHSGLYLQTVMNGQLRGTVPLKYVDALDENMAFAMIYGDRADIGNKLDFVLWDDDLQKSFELSGDEIRFGIDDIQGTLQNPVVLTANEQVTLVDNPNRASLFEIYPNPFTERAFIRYSLPGEKHVTLTVNNILGAEIARVVDVEQGAGSYTYIFEAKDLAPGIYFFTMKTDTNLEIKKVILHQKE